MIACAGWDAQLIVAARERGLALWEGGACFGGLASVAVGIHLRDDGVMDETVGNVGWLIHVGLKGLRGRLAAEGAEL